MSVTSSQEHSYLKVLFDFQYKTADGREITIKKNERLFLLQKTNADWWQVVRNLEQRSFYVPASYVRETSKPSLLSGRKNSEEDRETIFERPQNPSYKSMPKESSNAMRNVKKWLAGAMESKPEPPKSPCEPETYQKSDASENAFKGRLKVGLVDIRTKSLERDRRSGNYSDREDDGTSGSPRSRESSDNTENSNKTTCRYSTSPKGACMNIKIESGLQDPFRRELESSLDRRNLGVKMVGRARTRSMNSEGSQMESEAGDFRDTIEKGENTGPQEVRSNLSMHEESSSMEARGSSAGNRHSRSLELEAANKFSIRGERSTSPKPMYARQMTIAGGATIHQEKKVSSGDCGAGGSGDHKILNDKRRTWAVEELMSELTQMCKERGTSNKKPAFQLKSTEIKTNFDPIEKLTREIHEMNRMRNELMTVETDLEISGNVSPVNVCKISINSPRAEAPTNNDTKFFQHDGSISGNEKPDNSHRIMEEATRECSRLGKNRKITNDGKNDCDRVESSSPKALRSPKSPKILDEEYNEANILNDCAIRGDCSGSLSRSLSPEKQTLHHENLTSPSHGLGDTSIEEPCYSNVKLNYDRARPKLRIKTTDQPRAELRLTPSLEKLASEIQFLPAKTTSQTMQDKPGEITTKAHPREESSKSDDSLERRGKSGDTIMPVRRLEYKGSFKTKRETRYRESENFRDSTMNEEKGRIKKCGLKKSSTLNCSTIPEAYRRFREHGSNDRPDNIDEISTSHKRRSRSLSDLEPFDFSWSEISDKEIVERSKGTRSKPVPLPRTKIPAFKIRESPSLGFSVREESQRSATKNNVERLPSRTIPELRKPGREKFDEPREERYRQGNKFDFSSFSSLEKDRGNFAGVAGRRNVNIESSTAIGFKSLLCASDSGSDNCLQSKELLSSSNDNLNDRSSFRSPRKSNSSVNFNDKGKSTRESLSDDQILSSNPSSEALHSESEKTATLNPSSQPSPISARAGEDSFECAIDLPPGWKQRYDSDIGQICFLNEQGDKWYSSNDAEGKIYFFEENSNESSWVLPPVEIGKSNSTSADEKNDRSEANRSIGDKSETGSTKDSVLANRELPTKKVSSAGGDWPHLCDGNNMLVLKEGIINRTKITENGKKLRKNWSTSYAVLTELFLLFFKDSKTFNMMKTGQSAMAKPDISVDLNGAIVEPGERASSRKNVYMISTVLGLQVLVQSDNTSVATEWFQEIHGAIRKLPFGFKAQGKPLSIASDVRKISGGKQPNESNVHEDTKKITKIARSRSMKMKRLDDSLEDLSGSAAERQTKIKAKLRRFFQRRPAVELLVKNGIYKDEPAFGSYLSDVCPPESPRVPLFVKTCIEVLESNEENMKTDGLYRASGNLSQIQKIRLQVDQYKLDVLAQEEDVHVLAGALKLFFRELKEPLIPSSFFKEAVNASMLKKSSAKIQCFREIVRALPTPNYDTLQYLLKHLLRVTSYQEFNRMHIPNLAIVFGPTLMWPAEESANMALDFMQQNLVIECLLSEYNKIFKQ